ncbi:MULTISPECIES: Rha family transcriptional regulator [Pseudomonas]|uniref:Rha family transcriptional regulator n=1 Tax=Pseudomonas TaxID=286 RepID=UPI0006F449CC|nr:MULTISPECIES: Rha family transcriptional regulator [Pseudomonas]KRC93618.1 transcriptional regulator [Pseudomonas sp. Root9]MBV2078493.1 Rha family transcriptional regulator [Pseudomonas carnis]MBV2083731.1 Rha family transcriptional regulator [Pseudomonas carnis]MDH0796855.1 Rha family transcriptional regulator [Pseudomonas carnis]MDO3688114.1 Rha family transcriptional regulator [Pseudomonas sp. DKN 2791]
MFNGIKEITMTTVEIAAMTGKRHDNVLRDAHAIVAKVNALKSEECSNNDQSTGAIEATYLDGRKAERPMLVLNKHMVFTLITGYDTGLRYTVVGRWIELEQAANPAFASQAITETLIDLQTRVDAMAPAYDEHVRKGTTTGYTWREACRLAGVANPDKVMEMFISTGRAAKRKDLTRMHPKYAKSGWVREVSTSNKAIQLTGHLFKVTLKGINEWLRPNAENIAKGLIEHRKPRPVVDTDGYVIDIKGDGAARMTIADLPKGMCP